VTLLAAVTDLLRRRGTRHALIGAAALAVHGVSRATRDIDLLAADPACLERTYWAPLDPATATVTIHPGDAEDPLAGAVRVRGPAGPPLDVLIGRGSWMADVLDRATVHEIEGVPVPVVTRADLILLKLYAGGPQDAWDIEQLIAEADASSLAEVEARLGALPDEARRLWQRIRRGG
jgi:predicted nucleotidyltransferase